MSAQPMTSDADQSQGGEDQARRLGERLEGDDAVIGVVPPVIRQEGRVDMEDVSRRGGELGGVKAGGGVSVAQTRGV